MNAGHVCRLSNCMKLKCSYTACRWPETMFFSHHGHFKVPAVLPWKMPINLGRSPQRLWSSHGVNPIANIWFDHRFSRKPGPVNPMSSGNHGDSRKVSSITAITCRPGVIICSPPGGLWLVLDAAGTPIAGRNMRWRREWIIVPILNH